MYQNKDLTKIKNTLSDNVGRKVKLTSKKGRKQYVTRKGVIESIYPSIFTVKLDTEGEIFTNERRVSYSYADILTRSVDIVICTPDTAAKAEAETAEEVAEEVAE